MAFQFRKASKKQRKARIGLIAASGAGKTYTALQIATGLGGRIAVIDTENRSSELYADRFDFDTLDLDTFSPETYVQAIRAAEEAGYDVLIIDSLSHAWMGKDGALEQVDKAAARSRSGNSFTAWREVTPKHNALVEALVRCKCHLIVTMRAKTEYVMETIERNGKKQSVPKKIGMAPVQRDGLEYEFDIVADMDWTNNFIVSKTRYDALNEAVINKPGKELGEQIRDWLTDGTPAPEPAAAESQTPTPTASTNGHTTTQPNDADTVQKALTAYHAALTPLMPNEADRKDLIRFAFCKLQESKGEEITVPSSTTQIPADVIRKYTAKMRDMDGESLAGLLSDWRSQFAPNLAGAPF